MSFDFPLPKSASSKLPRPISRTHAPFSKIETAARETVVKMSERSGAVPPDIAKSLADTAQDRVQRQAAFQSGFEKPSKASLQKAVHAYENTHITTAAPAPQKTLERLAAFFIPTPDPNVQKFNELHTLYATAIHVCGEPLRQLISEEDMQQTLETVWKTGKVDTGTLALYEATILGTVQQTLEM